MDVNVTPTGYAFVGTSAANLETSLRNYDHYKEDSRTLWEKLRGKDVSHDELRRRARAGFVDRKTNEVNRALASIETSRQKLKAQLKKLGIEEADLNTFKTKLEKFQQKNAPTAAAMQIPATWTTKWRTAKNYHLEPVTGAEFKRIKNMFSDATHVGEGGRDQKLLKPYSRLGVLRVWRVENRDLWTLYQTHGSQMQRKKCGGHERELFHVTNETALDSILTRGFTDAYAGSSAGTAFGEGVYFADDMGKSDQYASVFSQGQFKNKFVALVCDVNLGCSLSWQRDCTPDPNNCFVTPRALKNLPGSTSDVYDSIIVNLARLRFREYVLFNDAAKNGAYPKYVVTYRRE